MVASLWETGDLATKALMTAFYSHLAAGKEKAAALRLAKLDVLKQFGRTAPVFHWAGFLSFGESNSAVHFSAGRASK